MFNLFNRNMNSKVDTNIYLLVILLLGVMLCYFEPFMIPVVAIVFGLTYYFSRRTLMSKEIFFSSYLDNIIRNIERTNHYAVRKLDVGMAVFSKDGKLQWKNELFQEWTGKKNLEGLKPEEVLPLQPNAFELLSVKDGARVIQMNDRYYNMKYCRVQTQDKADKKGEQNNSGLMIYLTDITDFELLRQKYAKEKICLAYIRFDNYEDVMRGLSETNMANLNGEIHEMVTKWVAEKNGFICRMNKEQSLAGFTQSAVAEIIEEKFAVLDKVREIRAGNKIPPTLSIGVSCDGDTLDELVQNANNVLYLALGRGGDQAVVVQNKATQFFGGTSTVSAKATRVRARIVAQTINEQMQASDKVFIMGHANEDYDAIGSAIGMAKLSLSLNKETYIVLSGRNENVNRISEMLAHECVKVSDHEEDYNSIMVEEEEALKHITPSSLLILVDHHREILTASKSVLDAIPKRIIVDHHRRAEDLLGDTVLLYLEPSSSSTSELLTELVGYFNDRLEITPAEATALYAGIVLDTKNFAVQTGERTFEAAALLRRSGADPTMVRLMFKDDMDVLKLRARLLAEAKTIEPGIAISIYKKAEKGAKATILAAQLADRLINVEGIHVGVAINEYKDGSLGVSARSDGSVNVQIIMEELGGGGHQTVAGVQLDNMRAADIEPQIIALAKKQLEQLEEKDNNESDSVTRC
ncbi:MAG: DHH family phosphoesterase [Phascolarctobacterium sp.]|mgnify:FL=1|nr:DHH family phosphoesterase [Phascolarctobacterium sp.]MBR2071482.1 DHH family phosphoesterase [Phascolarctobacterium sp.]MBR2219737.1 DHH family phosphoesterase [Phascolarctobacterium sp.]